MRDSDPRNAGFDGDDMLGATEASWRESVRDLEIVDAPEDSRPSLEGLDVHDRPTLVP